FQGVNELAPFLATLIYNIIAIIILVLFIRVAGILFKAAAGAIHYVEAFGFHYIPGIGTYHPGVGWASKFENISYKIGDVFFKTADDLVKFNKALAITKPFMKLSGIAAVILGVMDILFTVGYSIAISVISADVNDVVSEFI
ncbi:MAG: hypothetical protein LBV22_03035, partial [Mycoplasmataceae bacterium]|nr:hypothetical protein [Mycoplasmataceae bacterium]